MAKAIRPFNISLFLVFVVCMCRAQSSDLLRLEYLRIPENNTGVHTERFKFALNLPLKLSKEDYFVVGSEYNQFNINFSKDFGFDTAQLQKLHIIDLNLGYITKWNDNWRLIGILTPRLASNLTQGTTIDDYFFNATATFLKDNPKADKPYRIVLGLSYNSTTGLPIPLPVVSYYKRFHPNWSYTLGIPKSNFKYHPSEDHIVQLALLLDGYFVNVQNPIAMPEGVDATRISLSALVATLGYQYKVSNIASFYAYFGKSVHQEGKLRDNKRNDVFLLNGESNFFIRGGFKVSIF